MFNVDSHFVKGANHLVCEDYTAHGYICKCPYIVVADGCSSAKNSDFGARILVRSCELAINDYILSNRDGLLAGIHSHTIEQMILLRLRVILEALELSNASVLATLMFAFVYNNVLYLYSRGDGTISIRFTRKDTGVSYIQTCHYLYASGAPYYLAYELDANDIAMYHKRYAQAFTEIKYIGSGLNNPFTEMITSTYKYDYSVFESIALDEIILDHIILSSDGLDSYRRNKSMTPSFSPETIDYQSVIARVKGFKNPVGEFVTRRVQKMETENIKMGIEHYDDVSVAAMMEVSDGNS
jgi:hypothetical protein